MNELNGYDNEKSFVNHLKGKKICELNPLFLDLFAYLFPNASSDAIINCWANYLNQKADILIKVEGKVKGISIKKGSRNSVHVERISDFIHFLISNHISRDNVIEYLKYHYADGTTNGKGLERLSVEEYKKENQKKIDKLNGELNNSKILEKIIKRAILKGNNSNYEISALIYGEVNDFLWLGKEDIKKIILEQKNIYSTSVHFGPLVVQPKNRCLNYNPKYEKDRFCV